MKNLDNAIHQPTTLVVQNMGGVEYPTNTVNAPGALITDQTLQSLFQSQFRQKSQFRQRSQLRR